MTLCPSVRRLGAEPRNAHTASSRVGHRVGKSGHVVFALTTAVRHSVVRSIVTSYAITVLRLTRHAFGEGHATQAGLTSGLKSANVRSQNGGGHSRRMGVVLQGLRCADIARHKLADTRSARTAVGMREAREG